MLSLADEAACFTDSLPVRIWPSMFLRMFPFSTSTQCFAVGTNQLRAAARSLTLPPSRLVAFGMLPFAWRPFSEAVEVKSLIQSDASALLRARDRDCEVGAAEEARDRLTLDVARHHELRRRARVLLADAAGVPARPDHRGGLALCVDVVRIRAGPVVRLRRPRRRGEEVLVRGQPGDRLRRVEQALPCAADLLGDAAAVVEDEGHRDIPVLARDVDRGEALGLVLRHQLLGVGDVLRRRRRQLLDAGLLEQVLAVGDDARARVVRDAVGLPAEGPRSGEALQPVGRVVEGRLVERRERARRHVLRHLGVAHLDHVRPAAAREGGVELLQVVGPVLVLDVHRRAGMVGLELLIGGSDEIRPAGLRVDLQPDGDAVRRRLLRRTRGRGGKRCGKDDDETESDDAASLHLDPSRVRRPCRSLRVPAPLVWSIPLLTRAPCSHSG